MRENVVIYIDILIVTNIIINYFLLILTINYCGYNVKQKYILISSLIGGFYSLISLLPQLSFTAILISKLICCLLMTLILFGRKNIFKNYYTFLIINFIFSGLMMILWFFIYPPGMCLKNGIVYFHISTTTLIISMLIAYIIINIFTLVAKKVPIDIKDYSVEIHIDNKIISLRGFVDTGNFLRDVFSATPVVICNYNSIKSILPQTLKDIIINQYNNCNINFSKYHIRFIPYSTIDNHQFIISFKPDKFILKTHNSKTIINDVYIGLISDNNLISKDYDIILNPQLIK